MMLRLRPIGFLGNVCLRYLVHHYIRENSKGSYNDIVKISKPAWCLRDVSFTEGTNTPLEVDGLLTI